jgi:hypothetical protein
VLTGGENVIGRDPDVSVRIEAPGVSRRHARILAEGGRFTLEDLGSKNGTFATSAWPPRPSSRTVTSFGWARRSGLPRAAGGRPDRDRPSVEGEA